MIDVVLKLSARDLVHADLASCGWAGSDHHLAGVAKQLERARTGEVDYLAVCSATDIPVAKGGVDYQGLPLSRRHRLLCGSGQRNHSLFEGDRADLADR